MFFAVSLFKFGFPKQPKKCAQWRDINCFVLPSWQYLTIFSTFILCSSYSASTVIFSHSTVSCAIAKSTRFVVQLHNFRNKLRLNENGFVSYSHYLITSDEMTIGVLRANVNYSAINMDVNCILFWIIYLYCKELEAPLSHVHGHRRRRLK